MNNKSITDFIKPTIITAQQYGTKVSVEIDHSDTDLDELMDAFQTLIVGLGYSDTSLKSWVLDKADEYRETDTEDLKKALNDWKFEDDDNGIESKHRWNKDSEGHESGKLENDLFVSWDNDLGPEEEVDWNEEEQKAISYEEWHRNRDKMAESTYRATDEDEEGFSNDGGFDGKPIKMETGTTYFTVPVNFYTDDLGSKVYDYEGMSDQFEEQLSELDKSAVVMVSVETQPLSKELIKAAKKYKKKLKI